LQEVNNRVVKARELLLCGDIEGDDYRAIKSECEEKINRLEAKLKAAVNFQTTVEPLWNKAFSNIAQLETLYREGTVEVKRKIVGSMFPENLVFDGCQHRTKRLNEIINIISLIDKELKPKKMGQVV